MKNLFKKRLGTVATTDRSKMASVEVSSLNFNTVTTFLGCIIGVIGAIGIGIKWAYEYGARDGLRAEDRALKSIGLINDPDEEGGVDTEACKYEINR